VSRETVPRQLLHLVSNDATAHAAWRAKAQATADNAHMRYLVVHLHRLLAPDAVASSP
jgi:Domain of unknown function (DUF4170)